MIHQHILASPRPGMNEAEFQDYWRYVHALKYARKIPQIRKYKVNSRLDIPGQPQELAYSGVAEIWLDDEKAQADSIKTPEFLDGALKDEKNWAAYWQTVGIDTNAKEVYGSDPSNEEFPEYKLMIFLKRDRSMSLEQFRSSYTGDYSFSLKSISSVLRVLTCLTRDTAYSNGGNPPFDAITHLTADSYLDLKCLISSPQISSLLNPQQQSLTEGWGITSLAVRSEWVLGPSPRPYPIHR